MKSAFLFLVFLAASSGQSLKVGEPAPPLTLERTLPAGRNATWAALRGKPVVVEFWATWCASCVAEIPHLNELVAKFDGIQFISITDESPLVVEPFLARQPIHGWIGFDREASTFTAYRVEARPQTILVDRDGVLRGVMYPEQIDGTILSKLAAGRLSLTYNPPDRLRILQDKTVDPVFALMLRPSNQPTPGGQFAIDPGKLQADNIALKVIIAYAYSLPEGRLEGPAHLLNMRYDLCVLLPAGLSGDTELLRDILERSFKLKIRHEPKEMDAMVLRLRGAPPPEFPDGRPMFRLAAGLESRLNRAVLDETGLRGRYKVIALPEKDEDLPQVLLSELGIELTPARRVVDKLVIDSMELPAYRVIHPGR
jgi:thiol-disulfide isomerase/thioredoxin